MTRDLVVASPSDSHEEGLRKMKQAGCRHLPVVEGDASWAWSRSATCCRST